MERKGIERFAPLAGLLFLVLVDVSILLEGDTPGSDDSALEIADFYKDNEGRIIGSVVASAYAAVMLVWFAASLREAIARAEAGRSRLASISFAGAVIVATGITVNGALEFAAAESADDVGPGVTQTIHVIYDEFWLPFAVGFALFALAAGLAAVRHGAFDKRLGWIAIVLGVICVTPLGFFGFLGTIVWIGIASVVLYRKTDPVGSGAAPPPSTGPSIEVPPGTGPPSPA